jgi:fucose permease
MSAPGEQATYQRTGFTRAAFGALLAFGVLNAVLGPVLPYLRAVEDLSYLVGALHQVAFSVGGGLAGLLAARIARVVPRGWTIRIGLAVAALAGLLLGYGDHVWLTLCAAFLVSLFGTTAMIALWAALADEHGPRRTVAMTEGEVWVSIGSIIAPALVAGAAASRLGWSFSFVLAGLVVTVAVAVSLAVPVPAARGEAGGDGGDGRSRAGRSRGGRSRRVPATLVVVVAVVALEFTVSFWLASYLDDAVGLPRGLAVSMVVGLYVANLAGRVVVSRLARRSPATRLLAGLLGVATAGLPVLLLAGDTVVAAVGIALVGAGIGGMFPLASSRHVGAGSRGSDHALGQVLFAASVGQVLGPLLVGVLAQGLGLRIGLCVLPALVLVAALALRADRSGP